MKIMKGIEPLFSAERINMSLGFCEQGIKSGKRRFFRFNCIFEAPEAATGNIIIFYLYV
jgi:hypothetical protein